MVRITCDDASLPDELIATYQAFGPRLAALPPCGECGDLTVGCLGGGTCTKADLASDAAWAPFHVDLDVDEREDPELVERRARAVLPLLAGERNLTAYARPGAEFGSRLVAWGRSDDALAVWRDVVAGCTGRDVPSLADETDRFAEALAAAKRYADAAAVAEPAVEAARQQAQPECSGGWPTTSPATSNAPDGWSRPRVCGAKRSAREATSPGPSTGSPSPWIGPGTPAQR